MDQPIRSPSVWRVEFKWVFGFFRNPLRSVVQLLQAVLVKPPGLVVRLPAFLMALFKALQVVALSAVQIVYSSIDLWLHPQTAVVREETYWTEDNPPKPDTTRPLFKEEACEIVTPDPTRLVTVLAWQKKDGERVVEHINNLSINYAGLDTVVKMPQREYDQWSRTVAKRYVVHTMSRIVWLAFKAWWNGTGEVMLDTEVARYFAEAPMAQRIQFLDPQDQKTFDDLLSDEFKADAQSESWPRFYKADYSMHEFVTPLNGTYMPASVVLFKQERGEKIAIPIAALINSECLVTREDGRVWDFAKTCIMQAAMYATLLIDHPSNAHFPMTIVNAATKTMLPQDHVLFQLLYPHFYLAMGVNNSVRHSKQSVAVNEQMELPFNAFSFNGVDEFRVYCALAMKGWDWVHEQYPNRKNLPKTNTSYLPYSFRFEPLTGPHDYLNNVPYGRFLNSFWWKDGDNQAGELGPIPTYVKTVVQQIPEGDPAVTAWADTISQHLPGFPDGKKIWEPEKLWRSVAMAIWYETIEHSTSHHTFATLKLPQRCPLRIRIPPPRKSMEREHFDWSKMQTLWDCVEGYLATELFFQDTPWARLDEVRYGWQREDTAKPKAGGRECDVPALQAASKQFLEDLQTAASTLAPEDRLMPLEKLAVSLQY